MSRVIDYRYFLNLFFSFNLDLSLYSKLDSFFWILGVSNSFLPDYYLTYLNSFSFNNKFPLFNNSFLNNRSFCKKHISRVKYGNRLFLGLFYGNPKLNFFYQKGNTLTYKTFFINSLNKNMSNYRCISFNKSNYKNFLRRPINF